jgi:hypothetical protein
MGMDQIENRAAFIPLFQRSGTAHPMGWSMLSGLCAGNYQNVHEALGYQVCRSLHLVCHAHLITSFHQTAISSARDFY